MLTLEIEEPEGELLHIIEIFSPRRPVPWERVNPKGFNSPAMKEYQAHIRGLWVREAISLGVLEEFPWQGPVIIEWKAFYDKNAPSRGCKSYYEGADFSQKPDKDNLEKQVLDSFSSKKKKIKNTDGFTYEFGAYWDDHLVVWGGGGKKWDEFTGLWVCARFYKEAHDPDKEAKEIRRFKARELKARSKRRENASRDANAAAEPVTGQEI